MPHDSEFSSRSVHLNVFTTSPNSRNGVTNEQIPEDVGWKSDWTFTSCTAVADSRRSRQERTNSMASSAYGHDRRLCQNVKPLHIEAPQRVLHVASVVNLSSAHLVCYSSGKTVHVVPPPTKTSPLQRCNQVSVPTADCNMLDFTALACLFSPPLPPCAVFGCTLNASPHTPLLRPPLLFLFAPLPAHSTSVCR